PYFHITNSTFYYRLIPLHLSDLQSFPTSIIDHFRISCSVSISGTFYNQLAFDEAHESCINKDIKRVIGLSMENTVQNIKYMHFRSLVHKNLLSQLPRSDETSNIYSEQDTSFKKIQEGNIQAILTKLSESELFLTRPYQSDIIISPLRHIFSKYEADLDQKTSLLNFHQKSHELYTAFIKCHILKDQSAKSVPRTKYTLKTFEIKKPSSHSLKKQLNDQSKVVKCLKKQIEISQSSFKPCENIHTVSPYPLSICNTICDKKGKITQVTAFKNSKSVTKSFFEKRYKDCCPPIFHYGALPLSFEPKVYIIDG
ncbi:unnamed protein product, partial [Owenia fusiformis]